MTLNDYKKIVKKNNFTTILNNKWFFIAEIRLGKNEFRRILVSKKGKQIYDFTSKDRSNISTSPVTEGEYITYIPTRKMT
jgi:hypothetical protein